MDTRMVGTFDLERYLRNSKKVDIRDIDLSQAPQHPLTEDEVQVVVEAGITSWDEWDDRGGGLYWHAPTWPALED